MRQLSSCGRFGSCLLSVLGGRAQGLARIKGSKDYPKLSGMVRFYQTKKGVLVFAQVSGLPHSSLPCQGRVFGFHIHKGTDCGGNGNDPFANAMSHYDPVGCQHPHHAGDLPPLFESGGTALCVCLTDRFTVDEVMGRTVILHAHPDDLTTQPSGGSGEKIACGVIRRAAK